MKTPKLNLILIKKINLLLFKNFNVYHLGICPQWVRQNLVKDTINEESIILDINKYLIGHKSLDSLKDKYKINIPNKLKRKDLKILNQSVLMDDLIFNGKVIKKKNSYLSSHLEHIQQVLNVDLDNEECFTYFMSNIFTDGYVSIESFFQFYENSDKNDKLKEIYKKVLTLIKMIKNSELNNCVLLAA